MTLGLAAGLGLAGPAARAGAPDKAACVASYERAQDLRRIGKLIDARAELITCSQPSCPSAATVDCARWLGEVEQSIPSVVVAARDASGQEVRDVRVLVDGHPLEPARSGLSVPVDPGTHTFRYESSQGPAVEERLTIREGEKNRVLRVALGASKPDAAPPAKPSSGRPVPALVWVLGGVGVAGLAVFTGVGASSLVDESALRSTCAPRCPEEDVHAIRVKHTVADIGLGVGVASLGAAMVLYVTRPAAKTPQASARGADLTLRLSIGGAAVRGAF